MSRYVLILLILLNKIRIVHFISILIMFFTAGDHLMILGGYDGNTLSDVEVLDMQTDDTGCNPTDLLSPIDSHATVYSSALQSLITCGGYGTNHRNNGYGRLSSCSVQSKNGHQISLPPMNSARSSFAMVSIRNQLISIGGVGGYNTMETIELNDATAWSQQMMPFSVVYHCAVTLENNVIIMGGRDENWNVSRTFNFIYVNMESTIDDIIKPRI